MTEEKRTIRVPLLLTPEEVRDLDDWQFSNRLRTRSDALREMMRREIERSRKKENEQKNSRTKAAPVPLRLREARRSA
jgi:hypothetical protein